MKIKDYIKFLEANYDPETEIINDLWTKGEVETRAEDQEIELTDKQAIEVVRWLESNVDCEIGINWDQIDYAISQVKENEETKL